MQLTDTILSSLPQGSGTVLLAGSGPGGAPEWEAKGLTVVRLDVEPRCNPDIVASMTDMGEIGPYEVVFCCHSLEHLYPHEVFQALCEFHRVLKPGGVAVILVPDLEDVRPTEGRLDYPGEENMCGLHLFYGDARQIAEFPYMAHHSGFVASTLQHALENAGFKMVKTERMESYQLLGIGMKEEISA